MTIRRPAADRAGARPYLRRRPRVSVLLFLGLPAQKQQPSGQSFFRTLLGQECYLPTMPITVVVVVMPMVPIRMVIITVTRIVAAVIRSVVVWNSKSKRYLHSSLGLIWRPGNQTERDERQ